jgi:hypothetical protein
MVGLMPTLTKLAKIASRKKKKMENDTSTTTTETKTDDSIVFDVTEGSDALVKEIVEEVKTAKPKKTRKAKAVKVEKPTKVEEEPKVEEPVKVKKERKPRAKKEKVELRPILVPLDKVTSDRYHEVCKAAGSNATANTRKLIEDFLGSK